MLNHAIIIKYAGGGVAAGIFGQEALGGLGGVTLVSQLMGSASAIVFALANGFLVYGILAKTVGIKDHVVAVTQRVVSAIGGIPSWIGAIGDHIGGESSGNPRPPADLVSAS